MAKYSTDQLRSSIVFFEHLTLCLSSSMLKVKYREFYPLHFKDRFKTCGRHPAVCYDIIECGI